MSDSDNRLATNIALTELVRSKNLSDLPPDVLEKIKQMRKEKKRIVKVTYKDEEGSLDPELQYSCYGL